jgi:hypothetical protein
MPVSDWQKGLTNDQRQAIEHVAPTEGEIRVLLASGGKLKRSGVPHRKIGEPLEGPLAEVAAGGYIMHSAVSPSSKPSSTPKSDESPGKSKKTSTD